MFKQPCRSKHLGLNSNFSHFSYFLSPNWSIRSESWNCMPSSTSSSPPTPSPSPPSSLQTLPSSELHTLSLSSSGDTGSVYGEEGVWGEGVGGRKGCRCARVGRHVKTKAFVLYITIKNINSVVLSPYYQTRLSCCTDKAYHR